MILPIAIYASETWTLKSEDIRKLRVFENDCLRAMAGKTRLDRCRMSDIRRLLCVKDDIVNIIKRCRLTWFGHVVRRDENSFVKRSYKEVFVGKRNRGRPKKSWSSQVRQDVNIPLLTSECNAKDKVKWREIENAQRPKEGYAVY